MFSGKSLRDLERIRARWVWGTAARPSVTTQHDTADLRRWHFSGRRASRWYGIEKLEKNVCVHKINAITIFERVEGLINELVETSSPSIFNAIPNSISKSGPGKNMKGKTMRLTE